MTNRQRFDRNLGFLSLAEQARLQDATIAIAGVGGDGGEVARLLTRMGAGAGKGELRLADPDTFEIENINRQTACTDKTIGMNKVEAVGELLQCINPDATIKLYTDGVVAENVDEFVHGADLVIDESEFTLHQIAVMLGRASRARGIPVLTGMNIGFGGVVTTYRPDGPAIEEQLGLRRDMPIEEVAATRVPAARWAPYLPRYLDFKVMVDATEGRRTVPSVAPGMSAAASTTTTEALWNLFEAKNHRPKPVYFRRALVIDPAARVAKTVPFNTASYYWHGANVWLRNKVAYPATGA